MNPIERLNEGSETFDWLPALAMLGLSTQQRRVVALILDGKGDKQIAAGMGIGFSTVRTYLERIFARLHVEDRRELLLRVFSLSRKLDGAGVPMIADGKSNDSRNTDLFTGVKKAHSEGRRRGLARANRVSASRPPKASRYGMEGSTTSQP